MKIDWRELGPHPFGMVIDVDTGIPISGPDGYCCYVDEEKGEWKRYKCINHKPVIANNGRMVIEEGKGNVRFLPSDLSIMWERERCASIVDEHFSPHGLHGAPCEKIIIEQIRSGYKPPIKYYHADLAIKIPPEDSAKIRMHTFGRCDKDLIYLGKADTPSNET